MSSFAAVITSKGTGAISSIVLTGPRSANIITSLADSDAVVSAQPGDYCVTTLSRGNERIDHVVIARESDQRICISCHANPLIVERIMSLLAEEGATVISYEQLLTHEMKHLPIFLQEVSLYRLKAVTLKGIRLIDYQREAGLALTAATWQADCAPEQIKQQAQAILVRSEQLCKLVDGANVVIAGPPNSGKSTLFNTLCKKQKAIVTDIAGTTRDYLSAFCRTESLVMELFDTAGLDDTIIDGRADSLAQKKTMQLIAQADVVLYLLDGSKMLDCNSIDEALKQISNKPVIIVLNKSDLKTGDLPSTYSGCSVVTISAKNNSGIDGLLVCISEILGIQHADISESICFTPRQKRLLQNIVKAETPESIQALITELLNG